MDERINFAIRCKTLETLLENLFDIEESPRVWASVIIEILKKITDTEPDAEGCRKQIIERLYRKDE